MTDCIEDTDALMDPWVVIEIGGDRHLFGFIHKHPVLGGLSWSRSSPVIELNEPAGHAVTASGRRYRLGRRLNPSDLSGEPRVALHLLSDGHYGCLAPFVHEAEASEWLTAQKIARWLGVEPPPADRPLVVQFLTTHSAKYMDLRSKRMLH